MPWPDVIIHDFEGASIRLRRTDAGEVSLMARGADRDPVFRTAPGRIEASGGRGGELVIELPRSLSGARLLVDGQVFAEQADGELTFHVPGVTQGDEVVWR